MKELIGLTSQILEVNFEAIPYVLMVYDIDIQTDHVISQVRR